MSYFFVLIKYLALYSIIVEFCHSSSYSPSLSAIGASGGKDSERKVFAWLMENQMRIDANAFEKFAIALRYRNTLLVSYVRRRQKSPIVRYSLPEIFKAQFLSENNLNNSVVPLIAVFIGAKDGDSIHVRRLVEEINNLSQRTEGRAVSASRLSARLADIAHTSSLRPGSPPVLAANALIIDPTSLDIFLVDLSGNRYSCRAASIGFNSERLNAWLETRGVHLASTLPNLLINQSHIFNMTSDRSRSSVAL